MPTWQALDMLRKNIVIGLPRTGTTSLCAELSIPGKKFEVEPVLDNFVNPPNHTTKYLTPLLWQHQDLNRQLQQTVQDNDFQMYWTWRIDLREWLLSCICCSKLNIWGYPSAKSKHNKIKPFIIEEVDMEHWLKEMHHHNLLLEEWQSIYPQVFFNHYALEMMQYQSGKQLPQELKEQLIMNLETFDDWLEYRFLKSEEYQTYESNLTHYCKLG